MSFFKERDFSDLPSIPEYYKDKTIFITGGSGFLGKILVEKLLYSCSDLNRIYLLLRDKKGVKSDDRLNAIYTSKCFDRLRSEKPDIFEKKVFFIAGDVGELGLGISDEDRTLIINRTNIIFHVAASVRFDDSLKVAAKFNLRGAREIVELAKEVRNLEVYVQVSTAYAHTVRSCIDEVIYPPLADWRDTLEVTENLDEHTLKVLTSKYLGKLPNTYVFTKQLAEQVVAEQRGKLPIVIIRPTIVVASNREPMEGWMENFNGPLGLFVAAGTGFLRNMYTEPDIKLDTIPVDVSIKLFIAAAWERGTKKTSPTDEIQVYNCSSFTLKTMSLAEMSELGRTIVETIYPLEHSIWPVNIRLTTSKLEYNVKVLLYHILPALLLDLGLKMCGHKPMLTRLHRRIYTANLALEYFHTHEWTFLNKNIFALRSKIKEIDIKDFFYELEQIDIKEFFIRGARGAKIYLLNEKMENIPKARKRYIRMKMLDKTIKFAFRAYVVWFLINTQFVLNILQSIYSFVFGI